MTKLLYHADCMDGWCAAWMFKMKVPDAVLVPVQHGDPFQDADICVDFCFPDMSRFSGVILDHHKTAERTVVSHPRGVYDVTKSGAGLMLDFLNYEVSSRVQEIARIVQDRDLWSFELPETRAVSEFLSKLPYTVEAWDKVARLPMSEMKDLGELFLGRMKQRCEKIIRGGENIGWHSRDWLIVNSDTISELQEYSSGRPVAMWRYREGKYIVSLRSSGDYDVSAIAAKYGGGGHKNAAGFSKETLPWETNTHLLPVHWSQLPLR